jgi:hypothetical protein
MHIDTGSGMNTSPFSGINITLFTKKDVIETIKSSNFNKGLDPNCFYGNVSGSNNRLKSNVVDDIVNALNVASIPEYVRIDRLVPL